MLEDPLPVAVVPEHTGLIIVSILGQQVHRIRRGSKHSSRLQTVYVGGNQGDSLPGFTAINGHGNALFLVGCATGANPGDALVLIKVVLHEHVGKIVTFTGGNYPFLRCLLPVLTVIVAVPDIVIAVLTGYQLAITHITHYVEADEVDSKSNFI
ncbi:hypothetical protein ES703_120345 [subsurface metagenome]